MSLTIAVAAVVEAPGIGKPSQTFFNIALQALKLPRAQVMMVGDDIASDVGGAQV